MIHEGGVSNDRAAGAGDPDSYRAGTGGLHWPRRPAGAVPAPVPVSGLCLGSRGCRSRCAGLPDIRLHDAPADGSWR